MLKIAYFLEKTVKICLSLGDSAPEPHLPPATGSSAARSRIATSVYLYSFVKFISRFKGELGELEFYFRKITLHQ